MTTTKVTTPFPLGVYVGNPDNGNAANQAVFQNNLDSFTTVMGAVPQYMTYFIQQSLPVSQWADNTGWNAVNAAASSETKGMTPVISLPMNSTASGSMTSDQQFQAFASGQYDTQLKGIVQAWANQGFTNLVIRPGWEMNVTGTPGYVGDSAQSQADWVSAFQHIYTTLHQAAAAAGVNVQVVWNPGITNYSNANATANLYPGDKYVDIVGADMYSMMYPYTDSSSPTTYHDWNTGKEDTSVAQFIADPVNRAHYWSNPAANIWNNDASSGHSLSLNQLIQFAQAHGKPFALPETGAGNSNSGADVKDDPTFPQWLATQLTAAQAGGEKISFVNLYDSNADGNFEFSQASDGKPLEAAAWAQYFGGTTTTTTTTTTASSSSATSSTGASTSTSTSTSTTAPAAVTIGSGSDTIALAISEDAWNGNANFTISVDGQQIGGTQTTTASHSAGQTQTFNVLTTLSAGSHTVAVNFLNDAYGGSATTDRNLYVKSATLDGNSVTNSALNLTSNGAQSFTVQQASTGNPDTLNLKVSEDSWQGDAQFTVAINGQTIGGVYTATASHAAGATQDITIAGNWGTGAKTIGITFINDASGGTASTDRNLYVNQVTYDGQTASGAPTALYSNGTTNVTTAGTTKPVTLNLSEDAWSGNAQYSIAVDGKTVIANGSVTALHSQGQSQGENLILSAGTHDVAVSFLNDAYGGSTSADRNLYVNSVNVNGSSVANGSASLFSNGTSHFQVTIPTT